MKLLSNGRYHVAVDHDGDGTSRWNDLAVSRWREDAVCAAGGVYLYLRDERSGASWSPTASPRPAAGSDRAVADFNGPNARFEQQHDGLHTRLEIAVDGSANVELRRLTITNHAAAKRTLGVTSYLEIVLAPPATDSSHPAFSKLFIETEVDDATGAIVARRRPAKPKDEPVWLVHLVQVEGAGATPSCETDRNRFLGRGRGVANPVALDGGGDLSGRVGPVLDAVAAMRVAVDIAAGESATVEVCTGVAENRRQALSLAKRIAAAGNGDRILRGSHKRRDQLLRSCAAGADDAACFDRLAGALLVACADVRGTAKSIAGNRRGQSGLWGFGISGDSPIVVVRIADIDGLTTVRRMASAHAWWKAHGIASEVMVVVQSDDGNAGALLQQARRALTRGPGGQAVFEKRDGLYRRDASTLEEVDRLLLEAAARLVIDVGDDLDAVADRIGARRALLAPATAPGRDKAAPKPEQHCDATDPETLVDWNGHGGFSPEGDAYVIQSSAGRMTPLPWTNVLANPGFGSIVSESGSATTWRENAHEFRLTPWWNDPVADPNTEAIYVRDEDSQRVWSPTLLPTRSPGLFEARHEFGASVFLHRSDGIESTLRVFVDATEPLKVSWLTLRNDSSRARRLSVTGYVEWLLGDERSKTLLHVVTDVDGSTGAVLASNAYNTDFAGRTAFLAVDIDSSPGADAASRSVCGDRGDFIGGGRTVADPAAMREVALSGRVGAALDPCAAIRVGLDLEAGAEVHVLLRLGAGESGDHARALAACLRRADDVRAALDAVQAQWRSRLGVVRVRTPNRRVDTLANGWLLYQTLASRFWGRSGYYQSSGAYGFRDQLQDALAFAHAQPGLLRAHLLLCASRQFVEGDVQHWWHPPVGKGVRTRCSDDYLWLPFAASRYVEATGDLSVLDEKVSFLEARPLKDGEDSSYEKPELAEESASFYEHCVRAIGNGMRFGEHGLPLMRGGDWNDGMNLVGAEGRGESVWLAFFLVAVLRRFEPVARARGDADFAERCEYAAEALSERIDASAWDGDWYRRAWFDDGSPLGTAANDECRIDGIAQSWSAISGGGRRERSVHAMASLHRHLAHADTRLVQLLDPPFDTSKPSPGYIEGYVPGVRENGGQYTHAAVWAAMAFAALGDAGRAWELFSYIEPTNHGDSADRIADFRVEPYVVAGDVYAFAPHAGRGGWTWYTGSAGWMLQLVTESLLGFCRRGNVLQMKPLLPADWPGFDLTYRYGASRYEIACRRAAPGESTGTTVDGQPSADGSIELHDDGRIHAVIVTLP